MGQGGYGLDDDSVGVFGGDCAGSNRRLLDCLC